MSRGVRSGIKISGPASLIRGPQAALASGRGAPSQTSHTMLQKNVKTHSWTVCLFLQGHKLVHVVLRRFA